jgi:protein-S-isoprenylcysteine O-methyltransferase Ste14
MLPFKTIVTGTILLFLALVAGPYFSIQFDYLAGPVPIGHFRFLGIVPILFGAPLAVWSAFLLLVPGHGKAVPYDPLTDLKVMGPYKYTRNPFMLGWLLVLWGEVIFFRSLPLLFYGIILTLCIYFWIVAFEEPSLEDRYGEEYKRYKQTIPRWIPRLRHKS